MSEIKNQFNSFKVSASGSANIPIIIRKTVDTEEICYITGGKTALLFSANTPLKNILTSIDILQNEIKLRIPVSNGGAPQ